MELEWSQHHLRYLVLTQRALGFWNYWPGLHLRSHLQLCRIVSLLLHRALLSGNDRHGHCIEPIADTYADAYANSYADAYTNSYAHAYANSYAHAYTNSYAHAYTNSYAHAYANSYADAYTNSYAHAYANSYADGDSYGDTDANARYRASGRHN